MGILSCGFINEMVGNFETCIGVFVTNFVIMTAVIFSSIIVVISNS
jgi:hypothetical protein